jgi:hypothetical protein
MLDALQNTGVNMRKTLLAAFSALALSGGALAWTAQAQPADDDMAPPPPPPPGAHGPAADWMHHMPPGMIRHNRVGELIAPAEDRKLTGADVQKIAEAYLLWNGNRSWKVTNVTENQDNTVSFAYSTQSGDVVARFKIDRKTGHIDRVS